MRYIPYDGNCLGGFRDIQLHHSDFAEGYEMGEAVTDDRATSSRADVIRAKWPKRKRWRKSSDGELATQKERSFVRFDEDVISRP